MARDVRSIQFGREVDSDPDVDEVRSWLPAQATSDQIEWIAKVMDAGDMPASEAFKLWLLRFCNPFQSDEDEGTR